MNSIDLHGMIEAEAISTTLTALMSLHEGQEIEIITGNGQVLRDVVLEIVEEEGLHYTYRGNNYGSIIVYK